MRLVSGAEPQPSMDAAAALDVVQHALADNRIELHLQPIVKLPSRRTVHYEALSRVRDDHGTIVFPREYVRPAESAGLISALDTLLSRAEGLEGPLPLTPEAREALVASADGDGRFLLNQAETLYAAKIPEPLDPAALGSFLQRRVAVYDKDRDGHYNLISALHKAMRGSDPQASLYYLARMLTAGEEPLYVLRRMTRFASEDIGLADPQALTQCLAAKDAYQFLGSPEGELAIVQACLYLATAPKSNAAYSAQKAAWKSARETGSLAPPAHILNAPTKLMKDIGYGKDYAYDHEVEDAFSGADYWPDGMAAQTYYRPAERGFEREVVKRMEWWDKKRRERQGG